ncbi:MAG: 3-dehydroquinate synthase, partial [Paracoccaceae bacterium]
MPETVHVALGERAYDVVIAEGLLSQAAAYLDPLLNRRHVVIVADAHVGQLHLQTLQGALEDAGISSAVLELPRGEATKSWAHL